MLDPNVPVAVQDRAILTTGQRMTFENIPTRVSN